MTMRTQSWGARVAAMAVIAAAGVAIVYVPQPIQTLVAEDFGVRGPAAAAATIAVQAGYALGIVLLVSLGDRLSARRQVTAQIVVTAAALAAAAAAPSFAVFVALCFAAGGAATVGQLLVASALRLAPPAARARTAAVLLGSFLVGLFLVRTSLGGLADLVGWRPALAGCAIVVLALIPLSLRVAPSDTPETPPPYGRILLSIPLVARRSSTLRLMTAVHVLCFMAFIASWSMTTVFAVEELGLGVGEASLLGLAGLLGGIATIGGASLHARVGARASLTAMLAAALLGAVLLAAAPSLLPLALVGLFLLSAGMSGEQVTTQAIALGSVSPGESGRANTVFMASTFLGSAIATAAATQLYAVAGYAAVGAMATTLIAVAAVITIVADRRGMLEPVR
jgi:predicted MFS family arabinose efflux permease